MPTKLALYARVSTTDQHSEIQLHALRQYAAARGLEIVAECVDNGISGSKDRRPGLDALLADARRRRFDAIACTKLDRLARSVRHLTAMSADLKALGVDLIVVDQAIDTSTPSGKLLFHVLASISEFERELIAERTRAGIAAARRRGSRFGRPKALSDCALDRLRRLHRLGRSQREIAEALNASKSTVSREVARLGLHQSPSPASVAP